MTGTADGGLLQKLCRFNIVLFIMRLLHQKKIRLFNIKYTAIDQFFNQTLSIKNSRKSVAQNLSI